MGRSRRKHRHAQRSSDQQQNSVGSEPVQHGSASDPTSQSRPSSNEPVSPADQHTLPSSVASSPVVPGADPAMTESLDENMTDFEGFSDAPGVSVPDDSSDDDVVITSSVCVQPTGPPSGSVGNVQSTGQPSASFDKDDSDDEVEFLFSSPATISGSKRGATSDNEASVPAPASRKEQKRNQARVKESQQLALLGKIIEAFEMIDGRAAQYRDEIRGEIRGRNDSMLQFVLRKLDEWESRDAGGVAGSVEGDQEMNYRSGWV